MELSIQLITELYLTKKQPPTPQTKTLTVVSKEKTIQHASKNALTMYATSSFYLGAHLVFSGS